LIGVSYVLGIGVARDDVQHVEWITKAAEQGLVRAIAALGDARIRGRGTPADMISGWSLLLKAVNANNGIAQYNAAFLTLSGTGTVRYHFLSIPDALRMLERSAEAGVSASQYSLGHSYLEDNEQHSKDLKLARYWLAKAAAQGNSDAMTDLSSIPAGN
jgi:TPR repeat protein